MDVDVDVSVSGACIWVSVSEAAQYLLARLSGH